jgi:predicted O-methyltransferase YrrM
MVKLTQEFITAVLELSDIGQSKIGEHERELFGMSSPRLKALLNNLCSKEGTNYLELGTYKGSTLISAAYGNLKSKLVGVENYSYDEREPLRKAPDGQIWENMKSQLLYNIKRYEERDSLIDTKNITIVQDDFQKVDWKNYPKFDLCFFDIVPADKETYKVFFDTTLTALSSEAVIVFSNYSNVKNAKEIDEVIADNSHKFDVQWKKQRISGGLSDHTQYYSGVLIIGIKKKIVKAEKAST